MPKVFGTSCHEWKPCDFTFFGYPFKRVSLKLNLPAEDVTCQCYSGAACHAGKRRKLLVK